jgi:hypothetical protein
VQLPSTWRSLWSQKAGYGPSVPYTLDGYHEVKWTIPYEKYSPHYDEKIIKEYGVRRRKITSGTYKTRERLVVKLGTGKTVRRRNFKYFDDKERRNSAENYWAP